MVEREVCTWIADMSRFFINVGSSGDSGGKWRISHEDLIQRDFILNNTCVYWTNNKVDKELVRKWMNLQIETFYMQMSTQLKAPQWLFKGVGNSALKIWRNGL